MTPSDPSPDLTSDTAIVDERRRMDRLAWIQFVAGMILAFDLGGEIHGVLRAPGVVGVALWVHLVAEALATAALGLAFVLTRRQVRRLRAIAADRAAILRALRSDFDGLVRKRFMAWGLTKSETDIAFLTLRGLKITEIAALRETREGTIKAQTSHILHKSGHRTRTEFVAAFMDDFLHFAAIGDTKVPADKSASANRISPMPP